MLSESLATRKHTYAYSLRTAYPIGDFTASHWIVFVRGQATTISPGGGTYNHSLWRPPLPINVSARGPQGNPPLRGDRCCSRCHDAHILFVRKSRRFCGWSAEEEASLLSHEGMKEGVSMIRLRLSIPPGLTFDPRSVIYSFPRGHDYIRQHHHANGLFSKGLVAVH